ncbi:MAG: hypothetical protein GY870_10220 [archaeon]|nr:hypothetical protein [archaeon]
MVNYITIIGEVIAVAVAIFISFTIYRRDHKYIGNRLFIISMLMYGAYALIMMFYDLGISEESVVFTMSLALGLACLTTPIFVASFNVFIYSSAVLKEKRILITIIISIIFCPLSFIFAPVFVSLDPIRLEKDLRALLPMGLFQLYLFIECLIRIRKAITKIEADKIEIRAKINKLFWGQFFGLLVPVLSVVGGILVPYLTSDIGIIIIDLIFMIQFIFLALGMIVIGSAVMKKIEK